MVQLTEEEAKNVEKALLACIRSRERLVRRINKLRVAAKLAAQLVEDDSREVLEDALKEDDRLAR